MGERAAGDVVDARALYVRNILLGYVAAALGYGAAVYEFYGGNHLVYRHIVEHYDVGARLDRLAAHIEIFDLNIYLADEWSCLLYTSDAADD